MDLNEINYFEFGTALPAITLDDGTVVSGSAAIPNVARAALSGVGAHAESEPARSGHQPRRSSRDARVPDAPPRHSVRSTLRSRQSGHPDNQRERGLLFISYQRNIARQFSILNHDWMNNRDAPQAGGFDLLVGQNVPDDDGGLHASKPATLFGPSVDASDSGTPFAAVSQWVIPTGGAFLFTPSLAFVDTFTRGGSS